MFLFFFDVRSAGTGTYVLNDIYVLCTYYILYSYMLEFQGGLRSSNEIIFIKIITGNAICEQIVFVHHEKDDCN